MTLWLLWCQAFAEAMLAQYEIKVTVTRREPAQVIDLNAERAKRRAAPHR